jgi:Domain of unknown function (DUF4091)
VRWTRWCVGAGLLLATSALAGSRRARFGEYFVVPALTELSPASASVPMSAARKAELVAARGEKEGFLLVLGGRAGRASRLTASARDLRGKAGTLGPGRVKVYRAEWVDADGRLVPDALVPLEADVRPLGVARRQPARGVVLYVEIHVPRGAAPGDYKTKLAIRAGRRRLTVPVTVQVLPFEMPARASLPTSFALSSLDAIAVMGGTFDGAAAAQLSKSYALSALEHRVTLVPDAAALPDCRPHGEEGSLEVDFERFDRVLGEMLDGVDALDGARASTVALAVPPGLSVRQRFKYAVAFQRHLEEKGWADRAVAFSDEESLRGSQLPTQLEKRRAFTCALVDCLAARGLPSTWWKVPPTGVLSLGVGASLSDTRGIAWLAYARNAAGVRYTNALDGFGAAPEAGITPRGALFYPPKSGEPVVVESLRLKQIRDGLEDFELLRAAADAGQPKLALECVDRIAPSPDRITSDPYEWARTRRDLAEAARRHANHASAAPKPRKVITTHGSF